MVGRLSPEKRQDILIRAVLKSRYADRIQLHFAGSGPWEKKLRRMGNKLPHPPVFGYYNRDELVELIRNCDLYVHTSDIEIEGISCIEAFACGLVPLISDSKRSAAVQFALSPRHLFKAGNPASLAKAIDYWLEDPRRLKDASEKYVRLGKQYALERSVKRIESVYASLSIQKKNKHFHGYLFKLFSWLFYAGFAIPILFIWTHLVLGARIYGRKNLRRLHKALTVCNHVHLLDCALVALAIFPRKVVFPTLLKNVNTLWPGKIVRVLGGVGIPENITELKTFFEEMEFLLMKNHIVHFFPEGELEPYDTDLRDFKKGAFYLAAQAQVPIIPMTITFEQPKWIRRKISKKPVMRLYIGTPIEPVAINSQTDIKHRMKEARKQMESYIELAL